MIYKDIEIFKIFINSEKSHFGAGRAPVGHEQPSNSSITERGNKTVSGGKIGNSGAMQRERRAEQGGDAAWSTVKSRSRTACSSSAILPGVAPSGSCGVWRPSASPENPRKSAAQDEATSPADAAASAGQKNAE